MNIQFVQCSFDGMFFFVLSSKGEAGGIVCRPRHIVIFSLRSGPNVLSDALGCDAITTTANSLWYAAPLWFEWDPNRSDQSRVFPSTMDQSVYGRKWRQSTFVAYIVSSR